MAITNNPKNKSKNKPINTGTTMETTEPATTSTSTEVESTTSIEEVTETVDETTTDTIEEPTTEPAVEVTMIGVDTPTLELPVVPEAVALTLCPEALINTQLTRGLEGLRAKYEAGQMSTVGTEHLDIYNALTRVFHNLEFNDIKITLDNLFAYIAKYGEGHMHQNNALQNLQMSRLDVEKQKEYIKLISVMLSLRDPQGRGAKAQRTNWHTFPAGLVKANANVITSSFKRYFNIN